MKKILGLPPRRPGQTEKNVVFASTYKPSVFTFCLFRFSFQWLVLDVIGLTLSMSNLLGYLRCRFGGSDSVVGVANNFVRQQVMANMFNLIKTAPKAASQPNVQPNPSQLI